MTFPYKTTSDAAMSLISEQALRGLVLVLQELELQGQLGAVTVEMQVRGQGLHHQQANHQAHHQAVS